MDNFNKKELFKFLIQEFFSTKLPEIFSRELKIPLASKKVITLYGPRRSGKSFYFYSQIKELINNGIDRNRIVYINFEDDRILPLDFKELNSLIEAYYELYPENTKKTIYWFFDEIQNIKNWETFIRRIDDSKKAHIFITGSSSKLLSKEIATALRGRTFSFALYPLNFREFLAFNKIELKKNFQYSTQRFDIKKRLEQYMAFGGFPEVVLEKNITLKKKILEEYFHSLVYQDLAERYKLGNLPALKEIFKFLFTNVTSLFSVYNYHKHLSKQLPISRETVSDYLSYIQETDYLFFLPKFSYSLKEQSVNHKKIISLDCGLRNRMAFDFSDDIGKLAENLVGSFLHMAGSELYYWQAKGEVDFVIRNGKNLQAFNVTFGKSVHDREINSLLEFKDRFRNVHSLTLLTRDQEGKEKGINKIPLWKWLLKA